MEHAQISANGILTNIKESVNSSVKTWQAVSETIINDPNSMQSMWKGIGMMPEIALRMQQNEWKNLMQMYLRWMERTGKMAELMGLISMRAFV